jgi:hypothetical protein
MKNLILVVGLFLLFGYINYSCSAERDNTEKDKKIYLLTTFEIDELSVIADTEQKKDALKHLSRNGLLPISMYISSEFEGNCPYIIMKWSFYSRLEYLYACDSAANKEIYLRVKSLVREAIGMTERTMRENYIKDER